MSDDDDDGREPRTPRADARRNVLSLLAAAKASFAETGINTPVRDIARRAGVGVGTLYRHFPRREDLVAAMFRQELDQCADAAGRLAAAHSPIDALTRWMDEFVELAVTKEGLARALHAGDPAYAGLPAHRDARLLPAIGALLAAAVATGKVRADVTPDELLNAATGLCMGAGPKGRDRARLLVGVLITGMRTDHPAQSG